MLGGRGHASQICAKFRSLPGPNPRKKMSLGHETPEALSGGHVGAGYPQGTDKADEFTRVA